MNYIHQLRQQVETRNTAIAHAQVSINRMMAHLATDKFIGTDSNGDRKDWISTTDVVNFLRELRSELQVENS